MELSMLVTLVVTLHGTLAAGGYEYDPNYLVPSQCRACDAKSCPQLTFCAGVVVKDHCGCCNRCSSDLFQPHAVAPKDSAEPTAALPTDAPAGDVCEKRKCPKFKVCVINVQGLPICTCPSAFICRRRGRHKRQKSEEPVEICGTDGVTYASRCHLKIANCNSDRRIKRNHDGPCQANASGSSILNVPDMIDINKEITNVFGNTDNPGHSSGTKDTNVRRGQKGKKKQKQREKKRQRKREKLERRKKKQRKEKGKNKGVKRRQRSKRMKRRNEGYNMYPSNYGYLIGRHTKWSKNQIRRSQI